MATLKERYVDKTLSGKLSKIWLAFVLVGVLSSVYGLLSEDSTFWPSFLTCFFYFSSLALGGLFFVSLHYLVNAGWSVTVRRIAESFTSFLPVGLALALVIVFFGAYDLFEWLHKDVVEADKILQNKVPYLNWPFFLIRTVVFFGIWILLSRIIVGNSLKQDEDGSDVRTIKNGKLSIGFILFFALSYSLFSVDYLMSLHPHWFSTIFGVYCFAGLFQSTLGFMIILVVWLIKRGVLSDCVNTNHLHDLGKLLFAFTVFYAYIAFSQFMLIWYANLPEETIFYLHRSHGGWKAVSYSLLVFKFLVPFLALLPRGAKRNYLWLVMVSVLILVMQYVDVYWLVYPNFEDHVVFGPVEVGTFVGFLGLFLFCVFKFLTKYSAVPTKDPRLHEALDHHI